MHTDNSIIETTGKIYVELTPSGGGVTEADYVTLYFWDNDGPILVLDPERIDPFPEGSSATFDVGLDKAPNDDVTVILFFADAWDESAGDVVDSDISISPATLTFNTGTWNVPQEVTVAHADNSIIETSGELAVAVVAGGGGVLDNRSIVLNFEDNDRQPIELYVFKNPVDEGDAFTIQVLFADLEVRTTDTMIPLAFANIDAEDGDYQILSSLTIPANATVKTQELSANEDSDKDDEVFTVALDTDHPDWPPELDAVNPSPVEITIEDDDKLPTTVALAASPNPVEEGEIVTITATLSEAASGELTIPVTITDGTAQSGDYDPPGSSSITISNGASTGTLDIQTNEDADKADETFKVDLGTLPSGWAPGSPSSVEITIEDDDKLPTTVDLAASPNPVEEGEIVTITATLSEAASAEVTIPVTITDGTAEPGDYAPSGSSSITISNGALSGTLAIQTNEDDAERDDDTFTVSLGTLPSGLAPGSPSSVEITIEDDDKLPTTVDLAASPNPVEEGEIVTITATLSEAASGEVTVPVTITDGTAEPGDYAPSGSSSITISNGALSGTLAIQTNEDDAERDDDTFTVSLGTLPSGLAPGSPSSVEITIEDDDKLPTTVDLAASPNPVEEGEIVTITATLSEAASGEVTVPVTITDGTAEPGDYAPSGSSSITISNGALSGTLAIQTNEDDAERDDDTFTVSLGTLPSGLAPRSPSSVEITIEDDDKLPTVDITGVPSPINSTDAFTATFTFSEPVTGFETGDVVVTGGNKGAFSAVNASEYTLVITPAGGADVVVTVAAGAATDGLNTGPSSAVTATAVWDAAAPSLDITGVPSLINSTSAFTATFTFSKSVTDFETGDVVVTGGSKGTFSAVNASEYTLVITPDGGADVVVTVTADAATDGLNTGPSSEESVTAVWDATALTVDITGVPSPINSTDAFTATFTFSEPVTGFETGDVVVTGGNKGAFTAVNATEYTLEVTPSGGADVVVTVAADAATDGLNTGPSSAESVTAVWDATAPTVDITGVPSPINSTDAFTATFTFSEPVTGFETGDVVVTGGNKGAFTAVSASEYTLVVTPSGGADVVVTVAADAATDGLNTGPSSEESVTAVWDATALTVDITGVPSPINSTDAFTATFTFSEPVTGFETGDVVVTGGNKGAFSAVNASEYTLVITPAGGADVVVTVAAGAATDGLNTGPSSAVTATAVWDAAAPSLDITGVPSLINSTSAFTATFTFSKSVTDFETGDVVVTGGSKGTFSAVNASEYTLVITPDGGADVVVTVTADAATDGLNTGPSSAVTATAVWDAAAPSLDITGVPSLINSTSAFTATFTFSKSVTDFETGDVVVTGGSKGTFSAVNASEYTLVITPDGGADVVVTVTADAATDGLNTGPSSEESVTAVWDATALTVDITGVPSPINSTDAFTATFTFSEPVTGFETGDVVVTGGNKGAFSAVNASEYTLVITPAGGADVVVTVAAGAATDGLNTGPSSAESVTAVWDATAPTVDITGVPSPINSTDAFTATFTFSKSVTDFETGDVVVTGGNKGAFTAVNATEYTLEVTPSGGADVVVTVAAGAATDGLNTGPSSAVTATAVWDAAAPSLDITGVPSLINSTSAFTATFTFSKSVTDFETGDVVVTGGSKGTFSAVNASEYTLVITPDGGADVVVTVTADAATDGLNTGPSSAVTATAVWDAAAPSLDITGVPSLINSTSAFTATFTFSKSVTDFETGDVVVTGGSKGTFSAVNASEYTLVITPDGGADVVVTVTADAATDGLNTGPSSEESVTAVWDATALTVDITGVPSPINSTDAFTATFTFSEPVTGFETGDVVVTGGNKGAFTAVNATEYTLEVTPSGGADVVVTVAADAATDGLNTGPSSAESVTAVWDATAPTVDITGVPSPINSTDAFTATFTFSEPVTGFETGDVVVTGGNKGAFSAVNASEYTLVITPAGGADVVVTVAAGAATDGLNTGPSSAVTATAVWDAAAPSLDITGVPSLINSTSAFTATFTFSKSVTDFETGDVVVTGGNKGAFTAVNATEYTLEVTPSGGADVVVTVAADAATDGLNTGPSSAESVTAVWDATAPTVDITGVPSPINSTDAFTATFTFSEPVTGFETGDVGVTGGNKGAFTAVSASEYTLVVTPSGGADVIVTVAAGAATDGLNTGPSSAVTATAVWDATAPTVDITGVPSPINSTDAFTATFTFSEPVTGFETGDVVVTGGNKGAFTAVNATEYTLVVTPSGGADVVVTVAADAATDGLNTGPSSEESVTAVWDAAALTVDITGVPSPISSTSAFTATFTFSKDVTGFETGDVGVTGGSKGAFSAVSAAEYTLVVTPAGGADVVVTVAADAATDGLNTGPSSAVTATAVWDATAPSVAITGVPDKINSTDAFTATFTFDEAVTGFETGDVEVTGGSKGAFTAVNTVEYTLEVTPTGGSDVVVTVAADAATDGLNTGPSSAVTATAVWDAAPMVTLSASPLSVVEGGTITVTATLSEELPNPVTIDLTDTHVTTEPADYVPLVSITIAGGELTGSGDLVTVDDDIAESDETFTLALGDLPAGLAPGDPSLVELTILDDGDIPPPAEVSLSVDPEEIDEGGSITVVLQLSEVLTTDVVVPLTYPPGTTAEPEDYTALGSVTIPGGQNTGTGQIATVVDTDTEDETFIVALGSLPLELVAGRETSQLVTIRDIFPPRDVRLHLSATPNPVDEGDEVTLTVELAEALLTAVTIPLVLTDITADGQDYRASSPAQVEIEAGGTRGTYVVSILQDHVAEGSETFTVAFGTLPDGVVDGDPPEEVKVTIMDDDEAGIDAPPSVSILEGSTGAFEVSLTSEPLDAVTLTLTGYSGSDLTPTPPSLIFTPGDWSQSRQVMLIAAEDLDFADDEVALILSATGGDYTGKEVRVRVTIRDNDKPDINVPALVTVEEGGLQTFAVALTTEPSGNVTVTLPAVMGDLSLSPANLTFTPGSWDTPHTVTLMADEDEDFEDDQEAITLIASGGGYTGVTRSVEVTIRDNDEPDIVAVTEVTMEEGGIHPFGVSLSARPSGSVEVSFSGHAGTQLTLDRSLLTFTTTNWNIPQTVMLTAGEDDNDFGTDHVELMLAAFGGGYDNITHTTSVTITDNDERARPLELSIYDQRGSEDAGTLRLDIELSQATDKTVTVQYETVDVEAEAGVDYTASRGIVIFGPGSTRGTIMIDLVDDSILEEMERFEVTLSSPRNAIIARGTGTGTILDNDGGAYLRIDDALALEEERVVQFRVLLSHPQSRMVSATYRTQDGTAKAGEDYAASSGVVMLPPGSTEAVIAVPLLKDGLDWREETFTVHLVSSKQVKLGKSVGVATIQESTTAGEGILEAYAARFVRTFSTQVVDALGERFRSGTTGASCGAAARAEMAQLWHASSSWDPSLGELLAGCRMSAIPYRDSLSVWGRGAFRHFNGRDVDALTLDGEVTTGMLGLDYRWKRVLAGVLLAHSQGDGSFEVIEQSGAITAGLTGIYPYVSYARAGWDVWLSAGMGRGQAKVLELEGDLVSRFGAMGVQGALVSGGAVGLSYHGDILVTDAEIKAHGVEAEVYRVRAGVEANARLGDGLRPYVMANVRRDGGSAETGVGLEFGGGVRVVYPAWRLRGEVHTQGLVMHTAEAFTEWGFSGSLQVGMGLEGLMVRVRPSWGRGHGMRLNRQQTILDAVPLGTHTHRTELELGYGIPWRKGSARPVMGVTQSRQGTIYRFGGELRPWEQLTFSVYGLAHGHKNAMDDIGVNLRGILQY